MSALLPVSFSRFADATSILFGRIAAASVLLAVILVAGNFALRAFNPSAGGALSDLQRALFPSIFLLGGGRILLMRDRLDRRRLIVAPRSRAIIDLAGLAVLLLPSCVVTLLLFCPLILRSVASGTPYLATGVALPWPTLGIIAAAFAVLLLQGISEIIKCLDVLHRPGLSRKGEAGS